MGGKVLPKGLENKLKIIELDNSSLIKLAHVYLNFPHFLVDKYEKGPHFPYVLYVCVAWSISGRINQKPCSRN